MRVLLAGASGLLGQALRRALIANGDAVHVLVRREPRDGVETEWHPERSELDPSVLRDVDAVVCLSGVSLGRRRWSDQVKRDIVASRVQPVATLARALAETPTGPHSQQDQVNGKLDRTPTSAAPPRSVPADSD